VHRPRHLARPNDRRLGGWLVTAGLLLLAPVAGAWLVPGLLHP
jgi:hypothetical protein